MMRQKGEGNPYDATARLRGDGVVDPVQSRDVVGLALAACLQAPVADRPALGVFRM
jgi:3-methylcrotonyl-CoA carboxylase beta subunit